MGRAKGDAREQMFYAEFLSFADSHLLRRPMDTSEAMWLNHVEPHDDEVGHTVLVEERVPETGLGMHDRDGMMAETAIRHARGVFMAGGGEAWTIVDRTMFRPRELFRARVGHQAGLVAVLEDMLGHGAKMPRARLSMDYVPWLRVMVAAEDKEEAAAQAAQVRGGGRTTQNSLATVYKRTMRGAEELSRSGLM
ncbi:hypothetical protein HGRIS_010036 [Hohenbuehelia grisea]|uniref:Uncharacterized protein n=1 Tax=Hohenbuehelia grisea TaxID=104357 RepID=A0ABR3J338_9AGAR